MSTQETIVQPPEPSASSAPVPAVQRESVLGLLQTFSRQSLCDKHSADSKKIDLVLTYLWLRQLTEGLTFEVFLAKFASLADYDDQNRKHPEAALKHHCPRAKKAAEAANVPQWSAKECAEILSVYVDMCREAEQQGVEVPMTLDEYLAMDGPNYKQGNVAIERPVRAADTASRRTASATEPSLADPQTGLTPTDVPRRPDGPGQRIIYEMPGQGGRQIKGVTRNVSSGEIGGETRYYVSFASDEGELFDDVNLEHCTLLDEQPPAQRADVSETKKIWVPKAQYPQIVQALTLGAPMGNVDEKAVIYPFSVQFDCGLAVDVSIYNGEMGPYVEAQLYNPSDDVLIETLPPRQNIIGDFRFETADRGVLIVEIRTKD